jgi:hypothetical protein
MRRIFMRPNLFVLFAAGAFALGTTLPAAPALAQHEHQDLAIGSDAMGGGNLLLDYPFDERPVIRVSDSGAPVGLFTAGDPGFDAAGDEPDEGVFALPAGTEIGLEVVAIDEIVSLKLDNGVDGPFFFPFDGDQYRVGLIGDGVCNQGTMLCTAGDIGAACTEDADCHTLTPSIHNHPEYQLLLLSAPETFAEGRVTFRLLNTDVSPAYGESPLYTLTLSNGHLPGLEIEENPSAVDARIACQKTVGKAVRSMTGAHYKLLGKCLDKALAAEHQGKSESAAVKACGPDGNDPKSLAGRMAAATQKAEDKIAGACGPLDSSSEPYTLSQVRTHFGMARCRTEELIGAAYSESVEHMAELASGTCVALTCDGGLHAGDACTEDADCSGEEDVLTAFPCLKMSQAAD